MEALGHFFVPSSAISSSDDYLTMKRAHDMDHTHFPLHRRHLQTNATPEHSRCNMTSNAPTSSTSPLSVAPQRKGVLALPGVATTAGGVVVAMAFVESSALLASGSETTRLAVLVHWVDDPVDAGIAADGLVLWVHEDDLVVLVGAVLVDPVAVEHAQVGSTAADTLLSSRLQRALVLQLVDSLVGRLACITNQSPAYLRMF